MPTHDNPATFDVVVLGGGSGGYATALRAAQLGLSVALVEEGKVGGTCLHVGCVPTKALLHAAEVADAAAHGAQFGVRTTLDGIDMPGVLAYKDSVVAGLYKGLQGLIASRKITVVEGHGTLAGPGIVEVASADGTSHAGTPAPTWCSPRARTPAACRGLELGGRVITSDDALKLETVPKSVVVLGGGVIGVEFASVWKSFGADVQIVEALPHLVPNEDVALSKALERAFRKRGIKFSLGERFAQVKQSEDGVEVELESGTHVRRRPAARRRRTRSAHRRPRLRGCRRPPRPRLRPDRRAAPHGCHDPRWRAGLGGRRHRARPPARPPRVRAGHLRGRADRGPRARDDRRGRDPARHLLRARGGVRRSHRGAAPSTCTARTRSRPSSTTSRATARARSWVPRVSRSSCAARTDPWSACT